MSRKFPTDIGPLMLATGGELPGRVAPGTMMEIETIPQRPAAFVGVDVPAGAILVRVWVGADIWFDNGRWYWLGVIAPGISVRALAESTVHLDLPRPLRIVLGVVP